ncbi:hypothetical protein ILUMI_19684 [Ignelater luminosus]|uniref:HAT C-terminal dimerisation domain-containing protein n=1 Tax=Ignelater luminosus TaxID=2038154 RepID=A0A8K0CFR1_IGNLU|nr:hypothetical protein ILUMI_19684 [Ignelater luminosus]
MNKRIRQTLAACDLCQKTKIFFAIEDRMHHLISEGPNDILSLDLMVPLPFSCGGATQLLLTIHAFRIGDNEYENEVFEKTPEAGTSATATGLALTLKEELEKQLKQEKQTFKKKPDKMQKDYEKILKKEMACFEFDEIRGQYLTLAYDYILTVQPTSVEAERAFSAAGYICSSLRSRLGDDIINTICFLRAHFQKIAL